MLRDRVGITHGTLQQASGTPNMSYFQGAQEGVQIGLQLIGDYGGPFFGRFELTRCHYTDVGQ